MSDCKLEVIQKTQKLLGKYVKKPPLTEKLLRKPPFRFLHDVIKIVILETGFLKGLFSENELISENIKDKDAKIAFLTKLIDAVKTVTKTDLAVKPSKIVAGLEAESTNLLLQAIGKGIDKKLDTTQYIEQLNLGKTISNDKVKAKKNNAEKVKKSVEKVSSKDDKVKTKSLSKSRVQKNETPKSTDRGKSETPKESKRKEKTDKKDSKLKKEVIPESSRDNTTEEAVELKKDSKNCGEKLMEVVSDTNSKNLLEINPPNEELIVPFTEHKAQFNNEADAHIKSSELKELDTNLNMEGMTNVDHNKIDVKEYEVKEKPSRPKSARPKSGERENMVSLKEMENIKEEKPVEMSTNKVIQRPRSSLRPPSVRPSSARPGAPRLRPDSALPAHEPVTMGNINVIIETVTNNVDDEETVIIQSTSEAADDDEVVSGGNQVQVAQGNQGQLVEQILEQIQESDVDEAVRKRVEIEWVNDGLQGKDAVSKEIAQLRTLIQTLTKTANPLGKLLNFLHEDIDAMHSELQMWTTTKKQLFLEIMKQKKLSQESSKPLMGHLEHIEQEIKKQNAEILYVKANILRNEIKIRELLTN